MQELHLRAYRVEDTAPAIFYTDYRLYFSAMSGGIVPEKAVFPAIDIHLSGEQPEV